ncbi:MAG: hypothetical protein U0694_14690 [Anaerolineae bacterium]
MANIDNQRNVIREVADESGMQFIDLVPALQAAALTGDPTYYTYDSHWSTRGHQVAGETIAQYIQSHPDCAG